MDIRGIIRREVSAVRRDIAWEKEWKTKLGRSLEECMSHWEEYPSVLTRLQQFRGSVYRGKNNVVEFPYKVKHFIHRGRYGWATPDTWSMDYTLAKQLEGLFRNFVDASSDLIDYSQDTTATRALEIADGFKYYCDYQEREWNGDISIDEWEHEYDLAMAEVQKSCELMGKYWSHFWW